MLAFNQNRDTLAVAHCILACLAEIKLFTA